MDFINQADINVICRLGLEVKANDIIRTRLRGSNLDHPGVVVSRPSLTMAFPFAYGYSVNYRLSDRGRVFQLMGAH